MRRYFATLFVFAASASMAFAQIESTDDDFGIDVSIGAEKELVPDLELSVEANMRTQENSERIERYVLGGELSYKILNTKKFDMKVSGGFEYMWNQKMDKAELAKKVLQEAMPGAKYLIYPLSPAFITQGGPGCVAVQYNHL